MWLLDKMLRRLITRGELTIIDHRGKEYRYGAPDPEIAPVRRTFAARDEIVQLYDERFYPMWQFHLAGAEAAFRYGGMSNFQIQYLKSRQSAPITHNYLFQEEERLRGLEEPPKWHLDVAPE